MNFYFSKVGRIVGGVLLLAFGPILFFQYQYANDLIAWHQFGPSPHVETGHLLFFGRPVGGMLLDLQINLMRLAPSIHTLTFARAVTLALLFHLVWLLNHVLVRKTNLSDLQRGVLLVGFALQPPWLLSYMWLATAIPGLISCLLGFWSFVFFDRGEERKSPALYVLSALFLVLSLFTYQPGVNAFFWGFVIIYTLGTGPLKIKEFSRGLIFFALTCGLGLLLFRLFLKEAVCENYWSGCWTWISGDSKEYSWNLTDNPFEKAGVLWELSKLSFSSWLSFFAWEIDWQWIPGLGLFIMAFAPIRKTKSSSWAKWPVAFLMALCFLVLLNSANMITKGSMIAFRTLSVMTIFQAVGLVQFLVLFRNPVALKTAAFTAVSVLTSLTLFVGLKFAWHYQTAWEAAKSDSIVRDLCRSDFLPKNQVASTLPFFRNYSGSPYFPEINAKDFDLPVINPDQIGSLCNLLRDQGD